MTEQPAAPATRTAWTDRLADGWQTTTDRVLQILPVDKAAETVTKWFSVDETQVAEILASVRAQLPTTEALLIGKPQAGKSSIVRGLTGVSAEIVGQGFKPHTQSTTRYNYPSQELPLLVFTDTVGLGDIDRDTNSLIQELVGDLDAETSRPRILLFSPSKLVISRSIPCAKSRKNCEQSILTSPVYWQSLACTKFIPRPNSIIQSSQPVSSQSIEPSPRFSSHLPDYSIDRY
jgi:50S ribosome-binding GTPase